MSDAYMSMLIDSQEKKLALLEKAIELADKATSEALEWLDSVEDNAFLKELTEKLLRRKN